MDIAGFVLESVWSFLCAFKITAANDDSTVRFPTEKTMDKIESIEVECKMK